MSTNIPTIKILGPVDTRHVQGKNGPRTIYSQKAQLETEQLRCMIDLECDGPNTGHTVGQTYRWDIVADVVPGKYGPELARRQTLVPFDGKPAQKAA
jgi:hypothetical protein